VRTAKLISILLLVALLISVPVAADAHGFGRGLLLGLGAGLITGIAVAPRPVYVAPPVYVPPPVVYRTYPYPVPAPVPPDPASYGYSNYPSVSNFAPPPVAGSGCREWKLIDRHWEKRWNGYQGRWQNVLVEKWGWVGVPCNP